MRLRSWQRHQRISLQNSFVRALDSSPRCTRLLTFDSRHILRWNWRPRLGNSSIASLCCVHWYSHEPVHYHRFRRFSTSFRRNSERILERTDWGSDIHHLLLALRLLPSAVLPVLDSGLRGYSEQRGRTAGATDPSRHLWRGWCHRTLLSGHHLRMALRSLLAHLQQQDDVRVQFVEPSSTSTRMYANSCAGRDRALPHFFHSVDKRFQSPVRTIWLAAALAFILALPSLGSSVAFAAATSIATIGLYLSYGLPILVGLIWPKNFQKGPFDLGKFSRPVALVATLWICFITIIFCLPNVNPVDSQTLNYTPVAVGIVLVGTLGSWFLWAHRWFTGPIRQIEADDAGVGVVEHSSSEKGEDGSKMVATVGKTREV